MGFRARVMGLRILVVLVLVVLFGRLVWVQVVKSAEITRMGEELRLARIDLTPMRGSILDRRGVTMAVSVPQNTAVANTFQIKNPGEVAARLAPLVNLPAADILKILQQNPASGWVPIRRGLNQDQAQAVRSSRIAGISTVPEAQRAYPQGASANQIIGYVDSTGTKGEYGLEARYEKELRGQPGYVRAELTFNSSPIEDTIKELVPSQPGLDLVLTVDMALQKLVEARLDEVVKERDAKRGLVIAMDAHTGEILVMAMRPGAHPGDRKTWEKAGGGIDDARVTNWGVTPMSPGSIFKTITSAIALEERSVTLEKKFEDKGFLIRSGYRILNWDQVIRPNPEPKVLADLLAVSSNVGLIQVGETIPHDTFIKYLKGFGFMDITGLDVSAEFKALGLEHFEQKTDVDWANMYIGQHLEVTPIQMVTAVAVIANGGYLVQPHLVREVRDPDGKVVRTIPTDRRRQVISQTTAKEVQDLMVYVIQKGTAQIAAPNGYTAGGKTGTAQKFDERGQFKDRNTAAFVGFAPASNPQVVMLVMIDEPEGQGFGGIIAAPEFGRLMPPVLQSLGIPAETAPKANGQAAPRPASGVIPNVQWLPLQWAQERLVLAGFSLKTTGKGPLVLAQSVKPGAAARNGTIVELTLGQRDEKLGDVVHVPDFTGLSIAEASQLAGEIGLVVKASGTGFVAGQTPQFGAVAPARSTLDLRMAPKAR